MSKFNPSMLVPAAQVEGFNKASGQRTLRQVALDNIDKMREQFAAGDDAEGKLNFRVVEDKIAFTIRVNNSALILERVKVQDTDVDVKEMAAPKAAFTDALTYYADRIKAGEYDAQLATLEEKRASRTDKMRSTRAAKKAEKAAVPGESKKPA